MPFRISLIYFIEFGQITPSIGSVQGAYLTLNGKGFTDNKSDVTVKVGGKNCPIVSSSYSTVVCIAPPSTPFEQPVYLYINDFDVPCNNGQNGCSFTYSYENTPLIGGRYPETGNNGTILR